MIDIAKHDLYAELGYGGDEGRYDDALAEDGLSARHKTRILEDKRGQVEHTLASRFLRVCNRGDCRSRARSDADGRVLVPASDPRFCELCGGQAHATAVDRMVAACRRSGIGRVCVVGGSPKGQTTLRDLVAGRLELRLIDGTTSRRRQEAVGDLAWANLVMLWGATPLDHKVSTLYRGPDVVTCPKRGLGEMAGEIEEAARRRAGRSGNGR